MEMPNLRGLEGLTDIGLRGGVDMRPTLLRVLTDLYVQKLTHTAEEDRHYAELALRLLDSVDVAARVAVATRLANHLSPPRRVIERLAADLPEVASALRQRVPGESAAKPAARVAKIGTASNGAALHQKNAKTAPATLAADVAGELNELFFAATAEERRLILLNLHIVAALPPAPSVMRDPTIGRRLEAAALARKREEFAQVLAQSLRISRQQARRIAGDGLGEPIVVAAKALAVPREPLYRILLFVNTAVGHSVERVHALATLYDEINLQAAEDLVGIWRALNVERGAVAGSQRGRSASTARGAAVAAPMHRISTPILRSVRREAS
jgi:uncharacterized protein (DUF2336 family)